MSTRRLLRLVALEGMASALMVGVGETYMVAFALALGCGPMLAGLLGSAPLLCGALLQSYSPRGVRRHGHRRWVAGCAALQAASLLPLVVGAVIGAMSIPALFAAVAVYWGAGMATGPAWNAWVEPMVPRALRTTYFARRSLLAQLSVLVGVLGGGVALQLGPALVGRLRLFALLFGVALVARVVSALMLAAQPDTQTPRPTPTPLATWIDELRAGPGGRLLLLLLAMQLSVNVAAPYFTPYMLGSLGLSYGGYAALTAAAFAARIITLHLVGRHGRGLDTWTLLRLGSLGVVPVAALWLISDRFGYLLAIQLLSGAVWGIYELAALLLFFETIEPAQRIGTLTWFNVANTAALVAGSGIGALLHRLGGPSAYPLLFVASSGSRALSQLLLPRRPARTPRVELLPTRPLSARPGAGGLQVPLVAALSSSERGAAEHSAAERHEH